MLLHSLAYPFRSDFTVTPDCHVLLDKGELLLLPGSEYIHAFFTQTVGPWDLETVRRIFAPCYDGPLINSPR